MQTTFSEKFNKDKNKINIGTQPDVTSFESQGPENII
jgi:hypothetical protein